jgi:hypothetical protein
LKIVGADVYIALSKRLKVLVFAGDIDNQARHLSLQRATVSCSAPENGCCVFFQVPAIGLERWVMALDLPLREGWRAWIGKEKKRHFLRHVFIKVIILPRQARDKHRENSKNEWRFLRAKRTGEYSTRAKEHTAPRFVSSL